MTNWHALPFELKTLVLDAYIDCIAHDGGRDTWRILPNILWIVPGRSAGTKLAPLRTHPREFTVKPLLLVAPELQRTALSLIDKKLSTATKINLRRWEMRSLKGADVKACKLSIMRRRLEYAVIELEVGHVYNPGYSVSYGFKGLGCDYVNQQIEEASTRYPQPGQKC